MARAAVASGSSFRSAFGQRQRGVDQADVGERLREIPERGSGLRVDLLGEEPDVVRVGEESLEGVRGPCQVAALRPALDRPEAADAEGALAGRQPVIRLR